MVQSMKIFVVWCRVSAMLVRLLILIDRDKRDEEEIKRLAIMAVATVEFVEEEAKLNVKEVTEHFCRVSQLGLY